MDAYVERYRRKCHSVRQGRVLQRPRRLCSCTPMTCTTTSSTPMFMYVNDVDYVKDVDVNAQTLRLQRLKPASPGRCVWFITDTKIVIVIIDLYFKTILSFYEELKYYYEYYILIKLILKLKLLLYYLL